MAFGNAARARRAEHHRFVVPKVGRAVSAAHGHRCICGAINAGPALACRICGAPVAWRCSIAFHSYVKREPAFWTLLSNHRIEVWCGRVAEAADCVCGSSLLRPAGPDALLTRAQTDELFKFWHDEESDEANDYGARIYPRAGGI